MSGPLTAQGMSRDPDFDTLAGLAAVYGRYDVRISLRAGWLLLLCRDCPSGGIAARWPAGPAVRVIDVIGAITLHSVKAHPGTQG